MSRVVGTLTIFLLLCSTARAHKPSDSYLHVVGGGEQLQLRWDIALKDLEFVVGIDGNKDGEITWGEVKSQRDAIVAYALSRLTVATYGESRSVHPDEMLISEHSDGSYAALQMTIDAPGDVAEIELGYDLLFDVDPTHRGLVRYDNGPTVSTYILRPGSRAVLLRREGQSLWRTFFEYVREGVWHIWIGLDHILFLISLLLPAVLVRNSLTWEPAQQLMPVLRSVAKIVTVFTIAHSITLWLAVMEYVMLPSWFVEATIAFSIVIAACHNLYPVLPLSNWAIAFVFGLIHGFGFANVLVDLGLSNTALAVSLFGFNLGVEVGQMAIVFAFMPIAFALRSTVFYRRAFLNFGSVLVALIACVWIYERVCNVEILGI